MNKRPKNKLDSVRQVRTHDSAVSKKKTNVATRMATKMKKKQDGAGDIDPGFRKNSVKDKRNKKADWMNQFKTPHASGTKKTFATPKPRGRAK